LTLLLLLILAMLPLGALAAFAHSSGRVLEGVRAFVSTVTSSIRDWGIDTSLPWPFGAQRRPRIQISGPKERSLVCQICLGRIKSGLDYAVCDCGKVFHPACLSRTGFCPYCYTKYDKVGELTIVRQDMDGGEACPVCGEHVAQAATRCICGAIFVSDTGEFECPSCGTVMHEGQWTCPGCGEAYERCDICPLCGRVLDEDSTLCSCGLVTEDLCPECGWKLDPKDTECGGCGAQFEFVE
jgi:hypothetical protein